MDEKKLSRRNKKDLYIHRLVSVERQKFSSSANDWKKFEKYNESIAINVLFVSHQKKEVRRAYISVATQSTWGR